MPKLLHERLRERLRKIVPEEVRSHIPEKLKPPAWRKPEGYEAPEWAKSEGGTLEWVPGDAGQIVRDTIALGDSKGHQLPASIKLAVGTRGKITAVGPDFVVFQVGAEPGVRVSKIDVANTKDPSSRRWGRFIEVTIDDVDGKNRYAGTSEEDHRNVSCTRGPDRVLGTVYGGRSARRPADDDDDYDSDEEDDDGTGKAGPSTPWEPQPFVKKRERAGTEEIYDPYSGQVRRYKEVKHNPQSLRLSPEHMTFSEPEAGYATLIEEYARRTPPPSFRREPKGIEPSLRPIKTIDQNRPGDDGLSNIRAVLKLASPEELDYWQHWYGYGHIEAVKLARRHGYPIDVAAGVVAVLSPKTEWQTNLYLADRALAQDWPNVKTMNENRAKAYSLVVNGDFSAVGGPKVFDFFLSLSDPRSFQERVVIDTHAINIWRGLREGAAPKLSKAARRKMAEDYTQAGEEFGLSPQATQAITWTLWRQYPTLATGRAPIEEEMAKGWGKGRLPEELTEEQLQKQQEQLYDLPEEEFTTPIDPVEWRYGTVAQRILQFDKLAEGDLFVFTGRANLGVLRKISPVAAEMKDGRRVETQKQTLVMQVSSRASRFVVVGEDEFVGPALTRTGYQRYSGVLDDGRRVWVGCVERVAHGSFPAGRRQRRQREWIVKIDGQEIGSAGSLREARALIANVKSAFVVVTADDLDDDQFEGGGSVHLGQRTADVREYPLARAEVSGLSVGSAIDNTSSIGASLLEYTVLRGIREVPMSEFSAASGPVPSFDQRIQQLAVEIKHNQRIDPLIVVLEKRNNEGPYILEGSHRFDALRLLGVRSFPALVVIDEEDATKTARHLINFDELSMRLGAKTDPIGQKELQRWFAGPDTVTLISARETGAPLSQVKRVQHRSLLDELREMNVDFRQTRGQWYDPATSTMRVEPSVVIRELSFAEALQLARSHNQEAFIFKEPGGAALMYEGYRDVDQAKGRAPSAMVPLREGQPLFGSEAINVAPRKPKGEQDLYVRTRSVSFEIPFDWNDPKRTMPWSGTGPVTRSDVESHYGPPRQEAPPPAPGEPSWIPGERPKVGRGAPGESEEVRAASVYVGPSRGDDPYADDARDDRIRRGRTNARSERFVSVDDLDRVAATPSKVRRFMTAATPVKLSPAAFNVLWNVVAKDGILYEVSRSNTNMPYFAANIPSSYRDDDKDYPENTGPIWRWSVVSALVTKGLLVNGAGYPGIGPFAGRTLHTLQVTSEGEDAVEQFYVKSKTPTTFYSRMRPESAATTTVTLQNVQDQRTKSVITIPAGERPDDWVILVPGLKSTVPGRTLRGDEWMLRKPVPAKWIQQVTPKTAAVYHVAYLRDGKEPGEKAVVVIRVPEALARMWPSEIVDENGPPHFTIAYIPGPYDEAKHAELIEIVEQAAAETPTIPVELKKGVEWFTTDNEEKENREIAHKDVHPKTAERMEDLHWRLLASLEDAGFTPSRRNEFRAHSTLEYCADRKYKGLVPEGGFTARELEIWGWPETTKVALARGGMQVAVEDLHTEPRITELGTYRGMDVWIVDGETVRDEVDVDFVEGGNPERYAWMPEDEIWIEAMLSPRDMVATIVHEFAEASRMAGGMSYDDAHDEADLVEELFRRWVTAEEIENYSNPINLAAEWILNYGDMAPEMLEERLDNDRVAAIPEPKRKTTPFTEWKKQQLPLTSEDGLQNIIKVLTMANDAEVDYWSRWYHMAKADVAELAARYDLPFDVVAAVVAVLSPGNKWAQNVKAAEDIIRADRTRQIRTNAYPANIAKAVKLLEGGGSVTGPKVTVFYESLRNPDAVAQCMVLDGHAINIWRGQKMPLKGLTMPAKDERAQMVTDYERAADMFGLSPQAVQAITWYIWKSVVKPDAPPTVQGKEVLEEKPKERVAPKSKPAPKKQPVTVGIEEFEHAARAM